MSGEEPASSEDIPGSLMSLDDKLAPSFGAKKNTLPSLGEARELLSGIKKAILDITGESLEYVQTLRGRHDRGGSDFYSRKGIRYGLFLASFSSSGLCFVIV